MYTIATPTVHWHSSTSRFMVKPAPETVNCVSGVHIPC